MEINYIEFNEGWQSETPIYPLWIIEIVIFYSLVVEDCWIWIYAFNVHWNVKCTNRAWNKAAYLKLEWPGLEIWNLAILCKRFIFSRKPSIWNWWRWTAHYHVYKSNNNENHAYNLWAYNLAIFIQLYWIIALEVGVLWI